MSDKSFDILAREDGSQIISIEAKDNIKVQLFTPKGTLTIDYKRWEENDD